MLKLDNKPVLVIGLGGRGQAACELLRRLGARVVGVDCRDTDELRSGAEKLRGLGVEVALGTVLPPPGDFDLAVLGPAVPANSPVVLAVKAAGVPMLGELELGFQTAKCLSIVISGTNGKSTTAGLIERLLVHNHRKALVAGHRARPVCSVADQTKDLDFLILQANSFQLEGTEFFRPAVAVLLNLAPDHLDRYADAADYARATAGLFRNQQAFDWAIIQREALSCLQQLILPVPAKTITFSATDPAADLYLDRGLVISRIPNWSGPLLDTAHCQLRGPHNAENLMAALAVGHALRLPLENMVESLKTCTSGPHRCELVSEMEGVQFINDAKAANVDALQKALLTARSGPGGEANVWLIAGGRDQGLEFHDVGPALSRRVKRAFLIGEASEKIRAAWSLFTPCQVTASLLEAVAEAAKSAVSGDVVLFSPACPGFDQFRNYQHRGEIFCQAVKSIRRGALTGDPHMNGKITTA
ncbi:MAG TPA: UDP-N-acetylmuramoyl-L-alanine--D-glutamate ligase [Candidatus Acidoferrum sp.]|jgi:UDP-N-acetylmuramoylalanine--D-glutamate ligase|nr:UDP-N-acetylmuramoyl-L-alanine--D-glutamate ligase [Candidatus Acidoferrum sp.]